MKGLVAFSMFAFLCSFPTGAPGQACEWGLAGFLSYCAPIVAVLPLRKGYSAELPSLIFIGATTLTMKPLLARKA